MKAVIGLSLSLCSFVAVAWTSDSAFYDAATNALAHHEVAVSSGFTNELWQFVAHPSSDEALISAKMLKVVVLQEQYEDSMDESILNESISLSSNLVETTVSQADWQFLAASLVYLGCLCADSNDLQAFSVATNSLSKAQVLPAQSNLFLRAVIDYHDMPELDITQAFKAYASRVAAKCSMMRQSDLFAVGLPVKYQNMIREVQTAKQSRQTNDN